MHVYTRDGNGSGLNRDPPSHAPIREGFDSVLVGFKSGIVFHILTRVYVRAGLGTFWVHLTRFNPYIFTLYMLLCEISAYESLLV